MKALIDFFVYYSPAFTLLISILATVLVVRLIVYITAGLPHKKGLPRWFQFEIRGLHLHHFVLGNVIILALGFLTIVLQYPIHPTLALIVFGIGLGLILDEFTMWLGNVKHLVSDAIVLRQNVAIVSLVLIILLLIVIL
jgi:hypothetical protein